MALALALAMAVAPVCGVAYFCQLLSFFANCQLSTANCFFQFANCQLPTLFCFSALL
jgi:hypothetical protein